MERRLELSTGIEVELRPVPSYVLLKMARDLSLPDPPTKTVDTAAGEQEVEVAVDSPEYQAWMEEYRAVQEERLEADWQVIFGHGVKRWRNKPNNRLQHFLGWLGVAYQWVEDPPDNWAIPKLFDGIVESSGDRRLDYIYMELLADPYDFKRVLENLQGSSKELASEEVEAAEKSFRGDMEGNESPETEGNRGPGPDDVLRDGNSERMGTESA